MTEATREPAGVHDFSGLVITEELRTETGRRRYYNPDGKPTGSCEVCNGPVVRPGARTCRDCYMEARASTYVTLPCTQCGTEFKLMRAEHDKKTRKGQVNRYCSPACLAAKLRTGTPCEACGKAMPKPNGRRFCSEECRRPSRSKARLANGQIVLGMKTCHFAERIAGSGYSHRLLLALVRR